MRCTTSPSEIRNIAATAVRSVDLLPLNPNALGKRFFRLTPRDRIGIYTMHASVLGIEPVSSSFEVVPPAATGSR